MSRFTHWNIYDRYVNLKYNERLLEKKFNRHRIKLEKHLLFSGEETYKSQQSMNKRINIHNWEKTC